MGVWAGERSQRLPQILHDDDILICRFQFIIHRPHCASDQGAFASIEGLLLHAFLEAFDLRIKDHNSFHESLLARLDFQFYLQLIHITRMEDLRD